MRTLLMILNAVLISAPAVAETPALRVLGFLTEQGDQRCLADSRDEWVNRRFELGFVRVAASAVDLRPLLGRPVLAKGRAAPDYMPPTVKHEAECPIPQMRSDWVTGMNGIRYDRGDGPKVAAVRLDEAAAWRGLTARVAGEALIVTVDNDLGGPLEAIVYYEGCYGKPSQMVERRPAPVGRSELRFPLVATRMVDQPRKGIDEGRANHTPHFVRLVGEVPGLLLDLDVPVAALGVDVPCPKGE